MNFDAASATTLSVGAYAGCAIRVDDTLACWGPPWNSAYHLDSPPEGTFRDVSVGVGYACAIRSDGSLICWGRELSIAPQGSFIDVHASLGTACAVRANGEVSCWSVFGNGIDTKQLAAISPAVQVITADHYDCAIRRDDTLACVAEKGAETVFPDLPEGTFRSISTSEWHSCGIRTDDILVCWGGLNDFGEANSPAGTFEAVSAGTWFTCGIRTDKTLACWGYNRLGNAIPPAGEFAAVSAGIFEACAIRTDGSLTCWGDDDGDRETAPAWTLPAGPFKINQK